MCLVLKVRLTYFSMKLYGFVVIITNSLLCVAYFFVSSHAPSTKEENQLEL